MQLRHRYFSNPAARLFFFIRSKNNNKNCWEMGLLSLSNLEICIKKQNSEGGRNPIFSARGPYNADKMTKSPLFEGSVLFFQKLHRVGYIFLYLPCINIR